MRPKGDAAIQEWPAHHAPWMASPQSLRKDGPPIALWLAMTIPERARRLRPSYAAAAAIAFPARRTAKKPTPMKPAINKAQDDGSGTGDDSAGFAPRPYVVGHLKDGVKEPVLSRRSSIGGRSILGWATGSPRASKEGGSPRNRQGSGQVRVRILSAPTWPGPEGGVSDAGRQRPLAPGRATAHRKTGVS